MLVPWPRLMSIRLGTCKPTVPSVSEIYLGSDVANSCQGRVLHRISNACSLAKAYVNKTGNM